MLLIILLNTSKYKRLGDKLYELVSIASGKMLSSWVADIDGTSCYYKNYNKHVNNCNSRYNDYMQFVF